ncbi:MAG: hypothetical protein H0V29_00010 [Thermoleophilaceae bacterium]|nr:hypothetical protein [Thermoleophilaceae bacterium]
MRPVNLLPEADRPRAGGGGGRNQAYVVIGGLAVALLAVLGLVLAGNSVNAKTTELSEVQAETQGLQQQVAALSSFKRFADIKQTRLTSVSTLAAGRFDWERLMRELARVLPEDAWISSLDATSATDAETAAKNPGAGPSAKITGCAPGHKGVATVLVRLRTMSGVDDVVLESSSEAIVADAGAATGAAAQGDCGKDNTFSATIAFGPTAAGAPSDSKVPASLGGGK